MSRLDELKKQYPQLNITIFDLMRKIDTSKSYKYLPLICKLFSERFKVMNMYEGVDYNKVITEIQATLISKNISTDGLDENEMYVFLELSEFFRAEIFTTLKDFIYYMEKNKIQNKDVTSYKELDDLRTAVTLASIQELDEELSKQVIKEYEDDLWIAVRPLTFAASARYGASTRWCTTYQKEKQYFEKYWRQGILVYFINKKTGYKFAMFKSLDEKNDLSFWNAEDNRVDFLSLEIDDNLFKIVRKILNSDMTNKNYCSDELQTQVHLECIEPRIEKGFSIEEMNEATNEMMAQGPALIPVVRMNARFDIDRPIIEDLNNI